MKIKFISNHGRQRIDGGRPDNCGMGRITENENDHGHSESVYRAG